MSQVKDLLAKLDEIGEKAEYLSQKTADLVEENRSLKAKVASLEQNLSDRTQELDELSNQFEIVKFARNVEGKPGDQQSEELKKKINEYIREIDQCLKLIGD